MSEVLHFSRQDGLTGGAYELFFAGVLFVEELCSLCYWRAMLGEKDLSMSVPNGTDEVKQSEVECLLRWFSNQKLHHAVGALRPPIPQRGCVIVTVSFGRIRAKANVIPRRKGW